MCHSEMPKEKFMVCFVCLFLGVCLELNMYTMNANNVLMLYIHWYT